MLPSVLDITGNVGCSVILTPHLAEGRALLLLLRYVLRHPVLCPAELVVPPNLQELHLLFALIPFALQPPELRQEHRSKRFRVIDSGTQRQKTATQLSVMFV